MASRDPAREQHWRTLLSEWQQSKLTVSAFCKQRNLQKTTFYYWQRKLGVVRRPSSRSEPSAFVPVTLVAEPMAEMSAGGVVIRMPLAASREQIAVWLSVVKSC